MKKFTKKLSILFASIAMAMGAGIVNAAKDVKADGTLSITHTTFTEITASYTTTFTHTYTVGSDSINVEAYGVYKNASGIQMNKGKNTYIKNTNTLPNCVITSIELTWTATTKNSPTLYVNSGSVASTSSTLLGKGDNTQTTQTFSVDKAGNYDYFYFDGTTVTGACYLKEMKVTFEATDSATLDSMDVTPPTKRTGYNEGETLNTAGFKVEEVYSDESRIDITNDTSKYTVTPALTTVLSAGTTTFRVKHNGLGTTSTFNVTATARTLNSIEITQQPTKTRYLVGETLNTAGLVVTGKYSVGEDANLTNACTFNPTTLDTVGTQTITVTHTSGLTTTFNVTVVAINSIEVTTMPNKTTYDEGSTLDTTGIVVEATYSDGEVGVLTEGLSYDPTTLNTIGTQTITVTHTSGATTTFDVTVEEVQRVVKNGNYIIKSGNNYYLPTATAANTSSAPVATAYNDSIGSDQAWTFTYVSTVDGKDRYSISKNGLYLYATNTNNGVRIGNAATAGPTVHTWQITEADGIYTLSPSANTARMLAVYGTQDWRTYTSTTSGNTKISLISPREQTGIEVTTAPDKVVYEAGDTFDSTGMVVEAVYDDGFKSPISNYTVTPETLTLGTTEVTITQTGTSFSTTQAVTVNEKVVKVLNELVVSGTLTKAPFHEDDRFSAAGLTITAKYLAGEEVIEEDVTSKVKWDIANKILEPDDTKAVASYTYEGVTKTVEVEFEVIGREVVSIEVTKNPDKMQYGVGETFDPTGMEITVTYNFGEDAVITEGFTYTQDELVNGENIITIEYDDGSSTTLTVTASYLPYYDAQFGGLKYAAAYTATQTISVNGQNWTGYGLNCNNGSWNYTRLGGKVASTESDPKSYITTVLTKDTNKIEIKFAANAASVTGYKVTILKSDGTSVVESFSLEKTTDVITIEATKVSKWLQGRTFRLDVFKSDSGTTNAGADLSYVKFYEANATNTDPSRFISLVNAITEVTINSLHDIENAYDEYNTLTEEAKNEVVEQKALLDQYKATYDSLVVAKAEADAWVSELDDLIPSVDKMKLSDEENVITLRELYEELTDIEKSFVSEEKLNKLIAAENKIVELQAAADRQAAIKQFLADWKAMRVAGGKDGICAYLTEDNATLKDLLVRFMAFDAEAQAYIRSCEDVGGGPDTTIGVTMDFMANAQEWIKDIVEPTPSESIGIVITSNKQSNSLVALFAVLGLVAISAYYFTEKKKVLNK